MTSIGILIVMKIKLEAANTWAELSGNRISSATRVLWVAATTSSYVVLQRGREHPLPSPRQNCHLDHGLVHCEHVNVHPSGRSAPSLGLGQVFT